MRCLQAPGREQRSGLKSNFRLAGNPFTEGSSPHVVVQKCEHVWLPDVHAEMKEVIPIVNRLPDGRIDLQTMRFSDLLATGVQHLSGREGVIVRSVNEEDRSRDAVNSGEQARSQRRRAIKAISGAGEDYNGPQVRLTFS